VDDRIVDCKYGQENLVAARSALGISALATLAACGGGGSSGPPAANQGPDAPAGITPKEASRFLAQATNGATRETIDELVATGIDDWLTNQFAMPRSMSHWDWLVSAGYRDNPKFAPLNDGWDNSIWRQLITAPDQLRQRVALALLDFLVVSVNGLQLIGWRQFAICQYMDKLLDNAFGNYRSLLGAITRSVGMSVYLTFANNSKANGKGSMPDENYARELMQLFTIGLHELNADGTERLGADGKPIETFNQTDVSQLSRVFTGISFVSEDFSTPDLFLSSMIMRSYMNEPGPSTFLGHTVSGGGMAAVDAALDIIFAHPNVPPFVSKILIKRLVASNPSTAFVGRVAAVFADNGQGIRGDLKAVITAILTDTEVRDVSFLPNPNVGKLRDPVQRFTNWARAFKANSATGIWAIGDTSDIGTKLGQSPGRSPSVFNFFTPDYAPPNTSISQAGLIAPEFQITNEQSVLGYVNFMHSAVANGVADLIPDYGDMLPHASDSAALVGEINLILAAGQLPSATISRIRGAVDSIPFSSQNGPENRVKTAIILTLASPDYLTLR
jgi:uncharacterized protein (DUF1800 family)